MEEIYPKTVLVTGSAGFIGGNFVDRFKSVYKDTKVVGVDIVRPSSKADVFLAGSICDEKFLHSVFKNHKPEYVFHFAAVPRVSYSVLHPAKTTLINVYGTSLLLEKSRDFGVKRFIFSSSSSVYGGAKKLPTKEDENFPNPQSPYAAHKYAGEILCRVASSLSEMDTVSLRYFNVYGPGQYGSAPYSTAISAWLEILYFGKGKRPFLEGDGKQSRDFSYVDDVVQANIKAMRCEKKFMGEVFNVGCGKRTDLLEVKDLIEKYTGKKLDLEQRPARKGDVRHTEASIDKAREWFGFEPKMNFEIGLKLTVDWFKKRKK